jgi:transposase
MGYRFVSADREQAFLLPPDMRDWLDEGHVAWLVMEAVESFDLSAFRRRYRADGRSRPAFDPALMLALLLYGYCVGERSSRAIERRCVEDVAFRVLAGGHRPDHATIARFRVRHEAALGALFSQMLVLLAEAGLVRLGKVALDGTKIAASAAWDQNKTLPQIEAMLAEAAAVDAAEDAAHGPARGDEPPPGLARRDGRRERLAAARDRLAGEAAERKAAQEAKIAAHAERVAAGDPHPGRAPNPEPGPGTRNGTEPRANVTDPDARTVKSRHTLTVGYNAQAVVTEGQVIVGAMVSQAPVDRGLLPAVLDTCRDQLRAANIAPRLRTVLADAGYASEDTFTTAHADGLRLLCPLAKDTRELRAGGDPAAGKTLARLPETARAQRRLRHWAGRRDYPLRARTVEPVFGQIKTRQGLTRFARRGHAAASSEWLLACTAHNLLKLHTHRRHA